jgi:hypothetical protein
MEVLLIIFILLMMALAYQCGGKFSEFLLSIFHELMIFNFKSIVKNNTNTIFFLFFKFFSIFILLIIFFDLLCLIINYQPSIFLRNLIDGLSVIPIIFLKMSIGFFGILINVISVLMKPFFIINFGIFDLESSSYLFFINVSFWLLVYHYFRYFISGNIKFANSAHNVIKNFIKIIAVFILFNIFSFHMIDIFRYIGYSPEDNYQYYNLYDALKPLGNKSIYEFFGLHNDAEYNLVSSFKNIYFSFFVFLRDLLLTAIIFICFVSKNKNSVNMLRFSVFLIIILNILSMIIIGVSYSQNIEPSILLDFYNLKIAHLKSLITILIIVIYIPNIQSLLYHMDSFFDKEQYFDIKNKKTFTMSYIWNYIKKNSLKKLLIIMFNSNLLRVISLIIAVTIMILLIRNISYWKIHNDINFTLTLFSTIIFFIFFNRLSKFYLKNKRIDNMFLIAHASIIILVMISTTILFIIISPKVNIDKLSIISSSLLAFTFQITLLLNSIKIKNQQYSQYEKYLYSLCINENDTNDNKIIKITILVNYYNLPESFKTKLKRERSNRLKIENIEIDEFKLFNSEYKDNDIDKLDARKYRI